MKLDSVAFWGVASIAAFLQYVSAYFLDEVGYGLCGVYVDEECVVSLLYLALCVYMLHKSSLAYSPWGDEGDVVAVLYLACQIMGLFLSVAEIFV